MESEFLNEVQQLEANLREVYTLWKKTTDLSNKIVDSGDITTSNAAKTAQEELDERIEPAYDALEEKICRLGTACRRIKKQKEVERASIPRPEAPLTPGSSITSALWSRRPESKLQLAHVTLPLFNGKMSKYPTFKDDWLELV